MIKSIVENGTADENVLKVADPSSALKKLGAWSDWKINLERYRYAPITTYGINNFFINLNFKNNMNIKLNAIINSKVATREKSSQYRK